MQILFYLLFIISGAAGLFYESIWSRYLSLFVGHSAYAQVIVLTIFLGGMAIGALLVGRRSSRITEPLVWYAYVEMLIGVLGLVFHPLFQFVSALSYDSLFPALAGSPLLLPAKWLIAALLILPQSILLGTTFPLMSAGVMRLVKGQPGRVLSLLYFSNSLGAAAGVLIAGFVLVSMAGLDGTVAAAAILNLLVGILTLAVVRYLAPYLEERRLARESEADARRFGVVRPLGDAAEMPAVVDAAVATEAVAEVMPAPAGSATAGSEGASASLWRLLLVVSFGTAVASFIYEIAWIRMLSLVLGSATHSFELMLSAFILGLSLGAFWVRKRADSFEDPLVTLGNVQWLMGAAALATLPIYLSSFGWTATLMSAVGRNESGYAIFTIVRYVFCLAVMLPSTFLAGVTLPLITRTLFTSGKGERAIGTVYSVNTFGSIVGVAAAGLILMPLLGLKYLLIAGAMLDMGLGVLLFAFTGRGINFSRPRAVAATGLLLAAVMIAGATAKFDKLTLSSGVFRTGVLPSEGSRDIVFFKDGRTATVSVHRHESDSLVVIATNGKPDASLDAPWFRERIADGSADRRPVASDISTQLLLPLITLAHMPEARVAAVIGHGSGMSSHFLLGSSTLEKLYTIEIEPEMIEGARHFLPANKRVFDDPRSIKIVDDAKSYFAAANQKFDLILSEPSNPWVSGVSGLFTTQFYGRIKRYLSDDGVFGQWLHLYEISDGLVLSVLAALHANFPSYEIFQTSSGDILIVASMRESLRTPDWKVFEQPGVAEDLWHAVVFDSLTLEATRVLTRDVLRPLLDNWGEPNSDFYPVLDLGTEKTRFMRESATGFSSMWTQGFIVSAALMGRRAGESDTGLAVMPGLGSIYSRAFSARARRGGPMTARDSLLYPGLDDFRHRQWVFNALLRTQQGPEDWERWAYDFIRIEEDLHRGTAGFVDAGFYQEAQSFVEKFDAPPEIRQSLRFLRAVAEWDFPNVSAAADSIVQIIGAGYPLLAADFLSDAGTVAKLKLGDVAGARQFYDSFISYTSRPFGHFQSRILKAHLEAAEYAAGIRPPAE